MKRDVYIFDLDGTLYEQPRLRRKMLMKLLGFCCLHPLKIRELFLLQSFRSQKDEWDNNAQCIDTGSIADTRGLDQVDLMVCDRVATLKKVSLQKMIDIVAYWIYEEPLSIIKTTADERLLSIMEELKALGKRVVIFSDYPIDKKLKALGFETDYRYSSSDKRIGELKPSPKGLGIIAEDLEADRSSMIMIGDRMEKDGEAAIAFGVDYLILPRKIKDRKDYYRRIADE